MGIKYAFDAWPVKRPGIQITSKMLPKEVNKINGNKTARKPDIIRFYHRDDCGCYYAMIGFWASLFSDLVDKGANLIKTKKDKHYYKGPTRHSNYKNAWYYIITDIIC